MVIGDEGRIEVRPLLARIGLVVVFLTLLGAVGAWWLNETASTFATSFVEDWGGLGVALGFFMSDAFAVPIPPDLFLALAYLGHMPVPTIIFWGTAGSLVGGLTGFGLARLVARTSWVRARLDAQGAEMAAVLTRYGVAGLALGALTPLPYSIMAWTCSLLGMPLRTFVLVSLLRGVRVAIYLGLIAAGVVAVA